MFLAFEIMEEASLRQPGGLADLVHRSGCVALGQHQLLGGVEQLLFGQRIALGYVHGAYLPVGMTISRASSVVKPVFRESTAECCGFRIRPVTCLAGAATRRANRGPDGVRLRGSRFRRSSIEWRSPLQRLHSWRWR